jgi:hypothetical protein
MILSKTIAEDFFHDKTAKTAKDFEDERHTRKERTKLCALSAYLLSRLCV